MKVTDAGGLFAKDTAQITVNPEQPPPPSSCDPLNRPQINAQLILVGTLSEARSNISVASVGNKILFAGGYNSSGSPSSKVDIYDIATLTWSTAQLSIARTGIAAIGAGNKIYFAGGDSVNNITGVWTHTSRVDIYDVASNTWSTAELSEARKDIAVAIVGNKIMYAGGDNGYTCSICTSNKVDVYDQSTNIWSVATLSIARTGLSATTAGNKIYFAGGNEIWGGTNNTGVHDRIYIYDNTTDTWSTSVLNERKGHPGSIALGNYIYWAGGETWSNFNDYVETCTVEKRDLTNGTSTISNLFQPSVNQALLKNSSIVFAVVAQYDFFNTGQQFEIYNTISDVWSIGILNQTLPFHCGAISVNNIIYIAGGTINNNAANPTNQVWKLEF